jgi:hypothetical protein
MKNDTLVVLQLVNGLLCQLVIFLKIDLTFPQLSYYQVYSKKMVDDKEELNTF